MKFVPRTTPGKILAAICGLTLLLIIVAAAQGASKTDVSAGSIDLTPGSTSVSATPATVKHTVTFVVTGSPADVTYGHGGSSTHGHVPMHVTEPLIESANNYNLTAVLGESGTVKIKIYVNGKLIAHAKATGVYQAAEAVITKNIFTDRWESGLGG